MGREDVTVNGKKIGQILKELIEPFANMKERDNGTGYIAIEEYEKRLNSVVGIMNYNLEFDAAQWLEIDGAYTIIVRARFEMLADDGSIVLKRSANGASEVTIVKDTGKPVSVKSTLDSAQSEAFKNICKKLGMGIDQLREAGYKKKNENNSSSEIFEISITFQSTISSKKGRYVADAVDSNGEKVEFVLFQKEVPVLEKSIQLDRFIAIYRTGQSMKFKGIRKIYNGHVQVIFQSAC